MDRLTKWPNVSHRLWNAHVCFGCKIETFDPQLFCLSTGECGTCWHLVLRKSWRATKRVLGVKKIQCSWTIFGNDSVCSQMRPLWNPLVILPVVTFRPVGTSLSITSSDSNVDAFTLSLPDTGEDGEQLDETREPWQNIMWHHRLWSAMTRRNVRNQTFQQLRLSSDGKDRKWFYTVYRVQERKEVICFVMDRAPKVSQWQKFTRHTVERSSLLTSWTAIKQSLFSRFPLFSNLNLFPELFITINNTLLTKASFERLENKNGKGNLNWILKVYLNLSVPCWRVIVTLVQQSSGFEHVCEHDTGMSSCSVKAIKVNGPAFLRPLTSVFRVWFCALWCSWGENCQTCLWFSLKAESTTARRWTVWQRYTEVSTLNS